MDNFLQHQFEEGEARGEGEFTVSSEEALRKVAHFGLESAEHGILRLIQLLIGNRAVAVDIKVDGSGILIRVPDFEPNLISVESLDEELQLTENNFTLALLSCLYSGFERGSLRWGDVTWEFNRDGMQRKEPLSRPDEVLQVDLQYERVGGFWETLRRLASFRCLSVGEIQERLRYSYVPITLDGRPIRDPGNHSRLLLELVLYGPSRVEESSIENTVPPSRIARTFSTKRGRAELSFFGAEESEEKEELSVTLAHLWVSLDSGRKDKLSFVYDGVVIAEEETKLRVPVGGVVSAHGLDRDLSGLELVKNQQLKSLWDYLKRELDRELTEICGRALPPHIEEYLRSVGYLDNQEAGGLGELAGGAKGMAQGGAPSASFVREVDSIKRRLR